MTHSNTTYGQQSNIAILISNSTHDIISNVTGSRNRIGMDLAGNSLNNTIFNNTMQLSTGVDYMCNGNSGIGDENGGINYGTTKSRCRWLAAITVTSPSPHCGVALQSSLFNLYSDAQYTAGSTCFSAYSNITTINCNGHTVIATNGGTFALFRNAQKSTMENCFLKGFKTAISSQNSTMTVINNTIMGMPGNSSGIIINGARLGATVQANNVSGTATAISFGDITPGAGLAQSQTGPVTVTNDGNAGTGVSIYGSNWSNNPGSVGWTQWQAGTSLTSGTALGAAPGADTGVSLAAFGGSTQYSFGLDVPLDAVGGQHTQTITFVSQC